MSCSCETKAGRVGEMYELNNTMLLSVLIVGVRACSAPDRLFTSIPRGDNDTNTCKWQPGRRKAGGTRPFKPISGPSIKLVICVGQKSLWHCHFNGPPPPAHTHTVPLSNNPWGTQRAIDWLSCSPLRQIDNHCVLPALCWKGEAG